MPPDPKDLNSVDEIVPPAKKPAQPAPSPEPADGLVKARFVDVQAVFSPTHGIVTYGEPMRVTAEQLEQDPRFIPWDDGWVPDKAALAAANYTEPEG